METNLTNPAPSPVTAGPSLRNAAAASHDATSPGEPEPRAAAERLAPAMAALAEDEVLRMNLDPTLAVTAILGRWPHLTGLLPAIDALAPNESARIRTLRECALALYHWQSCVLSATDGDDVVGSLVETGIAMRERALADLTALSHRGLVDAAALANYRGTSSFRKVALDLAGLSALIHARWEVIAGRTLLTLEEADALGRHGHALLEALGGRDRTVGPTASTLRQRDRAFTLFRKAYDETRRAVEYLRYHEDDADDFVPQIYVGTRAGGNKPTGAGAPATTANAAAPATSPHAGGGAAASAPTSGLIVPTGHVSSSSPFEDA